jgi:RNA-splicing ligase RtcB
MTATQVAPKLLSWASDIEPATIEQAARTARLPIVEGHVALMPDAHVGIGSTVGSVVPTKNAIIPSCVGVDIGCGMIATETDLTADDLPGNIDQLMSLTATAIPSGVGKGHAYGAGKVDASFEELGRPHTKLDGKLAETAALQYGTLGSGNHFVELSIDERGVVWTVLHSGSRGVGNKLASKHIEGAKGLMKERLGMGVGEKLEDPSLAYLLDGEPPFDAYIADMLWAQRYAMGNRQVMNKAFLKAVFKVVGKGAVVQTINCHHNFTQRETHGGVQMWITRKGAIKAAKGDLGVIPGSMGTRSYIVEGKGSTESYESCSHGAGRRMSRGEARRSLTASSLKKAMEGRTWNAAQADALVDEHPLAYKDIDQVMADQADLVTVQHTLRQVFNYKGV